MREKVRCKEMFDPKKRKLFAAVIAIVLALAMIIPAGLSVILSMGG